MKRFMVVAIFSSLLITNINAMDKDSEALCSDYLELIPLSETADLTTPAQTNDPLFTQLHHAALFGNIDGVRAILTQWSDVIILINQQTAKGFTPLHLAVSENNFDIVAELMKHCVDTSLKCNAGYTAAELAAYFHSDSCADLINNTSHLNQE